MDRAVLTLLVLYQIKHWVCDYLLQGTYMLGKFKKFPDFIMPLLSHTAVHGVATYLIVHAYKPELALKLGLLDMGIHFAVDRIKADPLLLGRFKSLSATEYQMVNRMAKGLSIASGEPMPQTADPRVLQSYIDAGKKDLLGNKLFWYSMGWDQMMHHLTHYFIMWMIL
jgi:hypothetical protein